MKKQTTFIFTLITLMMMYCATKKNVDTKNLYNTTWELEYITGPRIDFEGLFPDHKPKITFDKSTSKVTGNTGCNGYSADYTLNSNAVTFGEPGPATLMYCGDGETIFKDMMTKINAYSIDSDGKLILMRNELAMMRFKKMDQ